MKTHILIIIGCLAASFPGHAQGTVNFANAGPNLNAPCYIITLGAQPQLAGAGYMAQLLFDTGGGSFTAVGSPATFIGAAAPGYFNGGVVTVNQVAPGAIATFQVFAWDSSTGVTTYAVALSAWQSGLIRGSYSNTATINTGGAGFPPSAPAALTGLQWVPEPSTTLLGLLGAGALLLRRRR